MFVINEACKADVLGTHRRDGEDESAADFDFLASSFPGLLSLFSFQKEKVFSAAGKYVRVCICSYVSIERMYVHSRYILMVERETNNLPHD